MSAKCDYCGQPGIQLVGETNGVLVCIDHAAKVDTPRYTPDEVEALVQQVAECEWLLRMTMDARDRAERQAEAGEAEVERLRSVLAEVQSAFDLQCPPMPPEKYVDRGAWMAHSWWNTVLGSILNREGVGTGAGEGATGQDTGTAWVTRSADCPEAPAQAHPLGPDGFTRLAGEGPN